MKKNVWWFVGSILLTVVFAVLCFYLFSGETITEIAPVAAELCVPSVQNRGGCYHTANGYTYTLSSTGFLAKNGKILTTRVTTMLPIGDGVAFTRNDTLCYMRNGNTSSVSAEVAIYGQYQDTPVYVKDGTIYQWKNGK